MSTREKFFNTINTFFDPIDQKLGPSRLKYQPGCDEDK
jgi:hypothetical protein